MARARSTWTPEQARHWAAVGRATRIERRKLARLASSQAETVATSPTWEHTLLARVRAQAARMLDLMDLEACKQRPDGQRLNWLASALERLAELDRVLSGRPLPGSRRPAPEQRADPRGAIRPPVEPRAPAVPAPPANGNEEEPPAASGLLAEPPDW